MGPWMSLFRSYKNIFSVLQPDILVFGKKMKVTDRDEDRTAHSISS